VSGAKKPWLRRGFAATTRSSPIITSLGEHQRASDAGIGGGRAGLPPPTGHLREQMARRTTLDNRTLVMQPAR
jgi:hypothetical protein